MTIEFPLGSRWYAWGRHHEVVAHVWRDGEHALALRTDGKKKELPVLARLFARVAVPSGGIPRKGVAEAAPAVEAKAMTTFPNTISVTIFGPNLSSRAQQKGTFHVHATGCADCAKYGPGRPMGGEPGWTVEVASLAEAVMDVYPPDQFDYDPVSELGTYEADFHVAPCVKFPGRNPAATNDQEVTMSTTTKKSARQAALEILREGGGPMPVKELAAKTVERVFPPMKGKTPTATVGAIIYTDAKKGVNFTKVARGEVALLDAAPVESGNEAAPEEAKPDPKPESTRRRGSRAKKEAAAANA